MNYGDNELFHMLGTVNHKIITRAMCAFKSENIHPRQIPLMMQLGEKEGLTQRELSKILEVQPSTLNVTINRMVKNGLLCKELDEKDHRISRIYISEEGKKKEAKIRSHMKKLRKELEGMISQEDKEQLLGLLEKLNKGLDELKCEGKEE